MRGIEKIINQILDEANAKKEEIKAEAEAKVVEIKTQAEIDGENIKNEILKKAESKVKNYEELAVLGAEQKRRRAILETKQNLIGEVVNKAYEKMVNAETSEYFEMVKKMLEKFVLPQDGEIIFNDKDKARMPMGFEETISKLAEEKGGSLRLSADTRKLDGGFVLVYGCIEENCTFKALIDANREEINDLVKGVLYG